MSTTSSMGTAYRSRAPRRVRAIFAVAMAFALAAGPAVGEARSLKDIVETYARSAVDDGNAVGVAVGVTIAGRRHFFAYGLADVTSRRRVSPDTIFQIGSVTKVFTTAILGQNAVVGINDLAEPLNNFAPVLGSLPPANQLITLEELANFTAGLPDEPPPCQPSQSPGCIGSGRPTIEDYTAGDFATYITQNYVAPSPLPAPFFYSDISIGLLGLLLGADPGVPLTNAALSGWLDLVSDRITGPLGMADTFLSGDATTNQQRRLAGGYQQALARASVSPAGQVNQITVGAGGAGYATPPAVAIRGGGGTGARAQASVDGGAVSTIAVTHPGKNYVPAPEVQISGGDPTTAAAGVAIVEKGRVVGVRITESGQGYSPQNLPTVEIVGGIRGPKARPARLAAPSISNGGVDHVQVLDGGRGYVEPISVIVAPGPPADNAVPIWAPAGALSSTARDMVKFLEVALGHIAGKHLLARAWLWAGLQTAMIPSACNTAPGPQPCVNWSGLGWTPIVVENPQSNGIPEIVNKNGGLPGFSTQLRLVPSLDLGIVVLVNSLQFLPTTGGPSADSAIISDNILFTILREGLP